MSAWERITSYKTPMERVMEPTPAPALRSSPSRSSSPSHSPAPTPTPPQNTATVDGRTFNITQKNGQYSADGGQTWASNALDATKTARANEIMKAQASTETRETQYARFASAQARGETPDQLATAKLATLAHGKHGETFFPYYTDASGRKWTEPELHAYADPVQASALRYASATGQPKPTIRERKERYTGESIIFLPDTRPVALQTTKDVHAVGMVASVFRTQAEEKAEQTKKITSQIQSKYSAFEKEYPSTADTPYKIQSPEEAYKYTLAREKLEKETAPLIAQERETYIEAGRKSRQSNRLITAINEQGQNIIDTEALKKWEKEQEAKYEKTMKEALTFEYARDKIATATAIGAIAGAKSGSIAGAPGIKIGTLAGGVSGVIVGTGSVLGTYAQIASEKDLPGVRMFIKPARARVYYKPEESFLGFTTDKNGIRVADPRRANIPQPIISPTKEGGFLGLGWELNPRLDLLGSTRIPAVMTPEQWFKTKGADKNYELIGRGDILEQKLSWGGTSGTLAGALIAPSIITKSAKLTMKKLPGALGQTTKSKAKIEIQGDTITRTITSETRARNIGDALREIGTKLGAGKYKLINPKIVTHEIQTGTLGKGDTATIYTGAPSPLGGLKGIQHQARETELTAITRTGSPIRQGVITERSTAEIARFKAPTSQNEPFGQAFRTTTAKGTIPLKASGRLIPTRGTLEQTDSFGIGWGVKVPSKQATIPSEITGINIGYIPGRGTYKLEYESIGATSGKGIGTIQPLYIQPPKNFEYSSAGTSQIQIAKTTPATIQTIPTIPIVTATKTTTQHLTLPTTTTATMSATLPGQTTSPTKTTYKQREQFAPTLGTTGTPTLGTTTLTIPRTKTEHPTIPTTTTATTTATIQKPKTETMTLTTTATIQKLATPTKTRLTTASLTPPPGTPKNFITPPSFTPPIIPIIGKPPTIPLGIGERGAKGRVKPSQRQKPKYAPSITASVFNVFTSKKQKATGWTGFEVRPMVIPQIKKTKKRTEEEYLLSPKLGLNFSGLLPKKRKKKK